MDPRVAFVAPGAAILGILLGDALAPGRRRSCSACSRSARWRSSACADRWSAPRCSCWCSSRPAARWSSGPSTGSAPARSSRPPTHGTRSPCEATLLEDPSGTRWSTRALAAIDVMHVRRSADHDARTVEEHRTVELVADGDAVGRLAVLAAGDRAVLRGWLRPLEGFDERLRWRHAVGASRRPRARRDDTVGRSARTVANAGRGLVLDGTDTLPVDERALVAGFLLGDTRDLPPDVLDQFRDSGLSHLLAVSGANVAFVLALVGPLLRRSPRALRVAATLARPARVRRDDPMGAVGAAGVRDGGVRGPRGPPRAPGDRRACARRSRSTVLLLVDPFLLRSVGFQLSCGASLGIALLARPFADWLRGPAWLAGVARHDGGRAGRRRAGAAPGVRLDPARSRSPRTCSRCRSPDRSRCGGSRPARAGRARARRGAAARDRAPGADAAPRRRRPRARRPREHRPARRGRARCRDARRDGCRRGRCRGGAPPSVVVGSESVRWTYRLGDAVHDLTNRTLVMGILNRTPDSFYDRGATFGLDDLVRRAEQLAVEGADLLDIGGVKAGPGPEVSEAEELDRVVPGDRAGARARRRRDLGRHVARRGARRGVSCRRGRRQRHQRLRRSRLRRRRREARRVGRRDAHPARAARAGSGAALRRPPRRRRGRSSSSAAGAPRPPGSRRSRSRSTPAWTSARRPR